MCYFSSPFLQPCFPFCESLLLPQAFRNTTLTRPYSLLDGRVETWQRCDFLKYFLNLDLSSNSVTLGKKITTSLWFHCWFCKSGIMTVNIIGLNDGNTPYVFLSSGNIRNIYKIPPIRMELWLFHSLNLVSSTPFGLTIFPKPVGDLHQKYQYQDTSSWGRKLLYVTYSPARVQAKQVAVGQPMIHLMALDMKLFLYA